MHVTAFREGRCVHKNEVSHQNIDVWKDFWTNGNFLESIGLFGAQSVSRYDPYFFHAMWITSKAGSSRYSIERERVQIKLKSPTPAPAVRMRHCGMNFLNLLFADRCGATGSCHPRRWQNSYQHQQWWKRYGSAAASTQHGRCMPLGQDLVLEN